MDAHRYLWYVGMMLAIVLTSLSCRSKYSASGAKENTPKPIVSETYRWEIKHKGKYRSDYRKYPDTSYVKYNDNGFSISHEVLYHPNNSKSGWICDKSLYIRDERDSLSLLKCYKYDESDTLRLRKTETYYRNSAGRLDSMIEIMPKYDITNRHYYNYDSMGRISYYFKKDGLSSFGRKSWEYFPDQYLTIVRSFGEVGQPYQVIDSIYNKGDYRKKISRKIDGTEFKQYGVKARINVDSVGKTGGYWLSLNENSDTLHYGVFLEKSPKYEKYIYVEDRDTIVGEEFITLDKYNRWTYSKLLENGELVREEFQKIIYKTE